MAISDNTRGAIFMAAAMAAFAFNDGMVKSLTEDLSIAQIMAVRGILTTVLVYAIVRAMGISLAWKTLGQPLVLLRTLFELGATLTFFSALARIEFATVSSIMQSLPLAVTLGAAVLFREPVGWRRWTAIIVGFLGVLLIIRPGPEGFQPSALFAVAAICFTAARDLTTRRISAEVPTLGVTLITSFVIMLVGVALIQPMGGWRPVSAENWLILTVCSVLVFAGYQAVILAMRGGEISFVAPFRYTSLVWALLIGVVFFGERPGASMLLGAAIVIGSGLYTFYRESRRASALARKAAVPPAV